MSNDAPRSASDLQLTSGAEVACTSPYVVGAIVMACATVDKLSSSCDSSRRRPPVPRCYLAAPVVFHRCEGWNPPQQLL